MTKLLTYTFLIFGLGLSIKAQRFDDDAAIWANIYLQKKINKKWDVHLNQQNRINNNVSQYFNGYADIGVTYHFNKHIKILADYVGVSRRRLDESYSIRHQFYTALILRQKIKSFSFSYRNMIQLQVKDIFSSYSGMVPVFMERNKLTVKYELNKRLSFYVAEELFLPFNQAKNKGLNRSRSFVGGFYKLSKKSELELYFAFQRELNAFNATNRIFIYGIGYSFDF